MLISVVSFAQENNATKDTITKKPVQLDEVFIVGNQKTDPVFTSVSNNYDEQIVQPKNVADLFGNINGFSLIKRSNYAVDPMFRASQHEQLNVQYDGGVKAMHACPNRMDPITTHIIPEEVSKIEIIKGPFSVRYGATFGGIINMVTQKPNPDNYGLHGTVNAGYESNGGSYVGMVQLQQVKESYDIVGTFGYRDYGDYEDGNGTEVPSSFRSTDYGVKVGYNINDNQRLQAQWRQSFGRDVDHAGLPMDTGYDDSSILSLDYKLTSSKKWLNSLTAKAYYSYVDHLMTNHNRPAFARADAASGVDAITAGGKLELNMQLDDKLQLYSGVDGLHLARDGKRTRIVKVNMMGMPLETPMVFYDKVWQDSYIDDFGIFSEAKWYANQSTIFTAGIRVDQVISDIQDPEEDFAAMYDLDKRTETNVSGTVSVKKLVSDKFTLEAAYGRGVRSANMIERYINHFAVGKDPYEYIGNPNLDAEVNNQFEIGFKGFEPLENGFNTFSYATSFYYSSFENYIVPIIDETLTRKYMPTMQPVHPKVFRNLDEAYKTGFEMMGKLDFLNNYFLKTELAYVYTKNKDLGESLPLNPPFNATFTLGLDKEKYWFNAQYNVTSKQDHLSESFGEIETDGYETLDIRLGFRPYKGITLGVAALNVFDEAYTNHLNFAFSGQEDFANGVRINDPGRNLTAFLQYKF
jgi:iron complex outermembrane receptor protein